MSEGEFVPKSYACVRWPELRVGKKIGGKDGTNMYVKFNRGRFTATSPEEVEVIESSEAFGVAIHNLDIKPKPAPVKPGPVETMIESEIEAALAERQPQARKGGIGTRTATGNKR